MAAHGFVGFDVARFDPVDYAFGRHIAVLAGLKDGEYVLHDELLIFYSYYSFYSYLEIIMFYLVLGRRFGAEKEL
jgi:hypothetical protein